MEKGLEFFKQLKEAGENSSPPHIVDSGASVKKDIESTQNENRD